MQYKKIKGISPESNIEEIRYTQKEDDGTNQNFSWSTDILSNKKPETEEISNTKEEKDDKAK